MTLRGVAVANPAPFDGDLFTAEAFVLRYKLRPLLSGRVEVEQLALENPVLGLIVDEDGRYNYEALGGGSGRVRPARGRGPTASPPIPRPPHPRPTPRRRESEGSAALDIVLSEVRVSDAHVTMVDEDDANLMAIEDANFTAALQGERRGHPGPGEGLDRAPSAWPTCSSCARSRRPSTMSSEQVQLSPIEAQVAGGKRHRELTAHLTGRLPLRREARPRRGVGEDAPRRRPSRASGWPAPSRASMSFEGTGPMSTLKANGHAEIVDCRIEDSKMLALLATVLKVPELASPEFEDCRIEYSLARTRAVHPESSA